MKKLFLSFILLLSLLILCACGDIVRLDISSAISIEYKSEYNGEGEAQIKVDLESLNPQPSEKAMKKLYGKYSNINTDHTLTIADFLCYEQNEMSPVKNGDVLEATLRTTSIFSSMSVEDVLKALNISLPEKCTATVDGLKEYEICQVFTTNTLDKYLTFYGIDGRGVFRDYDLKDLVNECELPDYYLSHSFIYKDGLHKFAVVKDNREIGTFTVDLICNDKKSELGFSNGDTVYLTVVPDKELQDFFMKDGKKIEGNSGQLTISNLLEVVSDIDPDDFIEHSIFSLLDVYSESKQQYIDYYTHKTDWYYTAFDSLRLNNMYVLKADPGTKLTDMFASNSIVVIRGYSTSGAFMLAYNIGKTSTGEYQLFLIPERCGFSLTVTDYPETHYKGWNVTEITSKYTK